MGRKVQLPLAYSESQKRRVVCYYQVCHEKEKWKLFGDLLFKLVYTQAG